MQSGADTRLEAIRRVINSQAPITKTLIPGLKFRLYGEAVLKPLGISTRHDHPVLVLGETDLEVQLDPMLLASCQHVVWSRTPTPTEKQNWHNGDTDCLSMIELLRLRAVENTVAELRASGVVQLYVCLVS